MMASLLLDTSAPTAPKPTEWILAGTGIGTLTLTLVSVIFVSYYVAGYRLRVRAWRDPQGVVLVRALNWGRLDGSISEIAVVVRHSLPGRLLRRTLRRQRQEGVLVSILHGPTVLKTGVTETWYGHLDASGQQYQLPVRWHPLRSLQTRATDGDKLVVRVDMGVTKKKYVRLVDLSGSIAAPFQETLGSGRARSTQIQAYLDLVRTLASAHKDGVFEMEDFGDQRDKLLDATVEDIELRHQQPDRNVESWKADALDAISLLRMITTLRRERLIPRSRSEELRSRVLPLLRELPVDATE